MFLAYAAGAASCLLIVEIVPQAPHRTLTRFGSSVSPIIRVRWLPHFGQTAGGVERVFKRTNNGFANGVPSANASKMGHFGP